MPTLEEVNEQIGHLPGKWLGRKEIKELPNILWEDETVERMVTGNYESGNGVLVATNKRLLFVDKGMMKLRVEDFPYDKISTIQYKTGMLAGTLTIFASGNRAEIKNVEKSQVRAFGDYVRARTSGAAGHASSAETPAPQAPAAPPEGSDMLDRLERLGKLKEQGMLTDEEFQAQKQKILDA